MLNPNIYCIRFQELTKKHKQFEVVLDLHGVSTIYFMVVAF